MKRIIYAGGEFVTDDDTADALMDYASVLAIVNSADIVRVQGIDADGKVQDIRMLVGPASQLLSMSTDLEYVELDGSEATATLRSLTERRLPKSFDVAQSGPRPAESDAESSSH